MSRPGACRTRPRSHVIRTGPGLGQRRPPDQFNVRAAQQGAVPVRRARSMARTGWAARYGTGGWRPGRRSSGAGHLAWQGDRNSAALSAFPAAWAGTNLVVSGGPQGQGPSGSAGRRGGGAIRGVRAARHRRHDALAQRFAQPPKGLSRRDQAHRVAPGHRPAQRPPACGGEGRVVADRDF
jgi:hypothetical protein